MILNVTGSVKGYSDENRISVFSPEAGDLVLSIGEEGAVLRTIRIKAAAGENTIIWDGLRTDGSRIGEDGDSYPLQCILFKDGKQVYSAQTTLKIGKCNQALLFALPSDRILYLDSSEDWFVEVCTIRKGELRIEIESLDDNNRPKSVLIKKTGSGEPQRIHWNGYVDGKPLGTGRYHVSCYASSNEQYIREFELEITDRSPKPRSVGITGKVLPESGASDREIWEFMMLPSIVADISYVQHQKVYASPSSRSEVLGTLHGRSQGMEVLSINDGWAQIQAWRHEDGASITGYVPLDQLICVYPSQEYGLLINKTSQTMKVYFRGEVLTVLPISTGLPIPGKLFRETPAGTYLTVEHMSTFYSERQYYAYPIRYDGGNLMHQIGYRLAQPHPDFTLDRSVLGEKASHGCIRIPDVPQDASGIDAYWLWTHLPFHTRVMIVEDFEDASAVHSVASPNGWSLSDDEDSWEVIDEYETENESRIPAEEEVSHVIRLTFAGDTVLGIREIWWNREDSLAGYLSYYGLEWPFSEVKSLFEQDDMTLVNLETVLKQDKEHEVQDKEYRFRGKPEWAQSLVLASVEQVNLANNHVIDYGSWGKVSTRNALKAVDIEYSGYGDLYIFEKDGYRIGFAGIRETTYRQNSGKLSQDIHALKEAGCDVIVFSCHWGKEYSPMHNTLQEEMAAAAVQAGADIVIGTHPHVVQGVSCMEHTPILWSLGNFMFGGTINLDTFDGTLARIELYFDAEGYMGCTVRMIPILTSGRASEQINDYRPVFAKGTDRERILDLIQEDSDFDVSQTLWFPARE